jgi:hypothetical protein
MSRLKDIEHDGFEFFDTDDKSNRRKVKKIEKLLETGIKENAEKIKAEAQVKYLSPENPLLWEGDDED